MNDPLVLGAVAYDPKVVTIWDGFQQFFARHGLAFDYVLYTSYERQVEQHFAGAFHVAWNSPLAWLQAQRIARARGQQVQTIAMRDTDRDLTSVVLVRAKDAIHGLDDLRGRTVGVGAADSPQATLIPLLHLAESGLEPERDFAVRRFDVLLGKHGDHIGGERDAARAMLAGEVDACCVIDGNHLLFGREGTLPPGSTRVLAQTGTFDHCNFTVVNNTVVGDAAEPRLQRFAELLSSMDYADPDVRPLMDLEGLKQWQDGRTSGYALLERACDRFGSIDAFVARVAGA